MTGEIRMAEGVHRAILEQVGTREPETGGMLGMEGDVITRFWFDAGGRSLPDAYLPDTAGCEAVINGPWQAQGVRFCGFVHSHRDTPCPSVPDRRYMQQLCLAMGAPEMLLGVLCGGAVHLWRMRPGEDGFCRAEETPLSLT